MKKGGSQPRGKGGGGNAAHTRDDDERERMKVTSPYLRISEDMMRVKIM